jgi:hypothetical protein
MSEFRAGRSQMGTRVAFFLKGCYQKQTYRIDIPSMPRNAVKPTQPLTGFLRSNAIVCCTSTNDQGRRTLVPGISRELCIQKPAEAGPYSLVIGYTFLPRAIRIGISLGICFVGSARKRWSVFSMVSGLDASSLHPTCVAQALCPFEQRFHQRHEPPVPLVLRWSTVMNPARAKGPPSCQVGG